MLLTVFILACDGSSGLGGSTMNSSSVLGDDPVLKGLSFSKTGHGEVSLGDGGVVTFQPAVVIPLICAVDLPLHHIANNLTTSIVGRHSPGQGDRGTGNVCHFGFTRRI